MAAGPRLPAAVRADSPDGRAYFAAAAASAFRKSVSVKP